jgi:MFS superfamily sulfate permease-like transporter
VVLMIVSLFMTSVDALQLLTAHCVCGAGLVVMFVLLFMTPVFELMPYNAMGAIIVSGVIGLFEGKEAWFLLKTNFTDFLVWLAAFLGTFFFGVEVGLGTAIGLALLLVIYQVAFPHTALLGKLPETGVNPFHVQARQYVLLALG